MFTTLIALAAAPCLATTVDDAPASGPRLVVELEPPMLLSGGIGGALGVQTGQVAFGVMGFATPLSDGYRDWFLSGAEGLEVPVNWGAEVFVDAYLLKAGWLNPFAGAIASLDGFALRDPTTGNGKTVHGAYIVPRVGLRLSHPALPWLYAEPSVGVPLRVWDDGQRVAGRDVDVRPITWLPFATVGVSLPLGRRVARDQPDPS